jgi:hypothetical protein
VKDDVIDVGVKKFEKIAADNGFTITDVSRDGNCALHAVIHQLMLQSEQQNSVLDVTMLRSQAVSYLRTHDELLDENFLVTRHYATAQCYLSKQCHSGEWVDEIMLRAISCCIGKDIHILHDNGYTTILKATDSSQMDNSTCQPIFIGQIGEQHYLSLHKTNDGENIPIHQPKLTNLS